MMRDKNTTTQRVGILCIKNLIFRNFVVLNMGLYQEEYRNFVLLNMGLYQEEYICKVVTTVEILCKL